MLSPHCPHVVPMLSPCCPHVVSTSLWSPHCPHIVSTLSSCCPHVVYTSLWSPHCPHVVSHVVPMWSPHPCGPHIVSTLSSCCPHVPMLKINFVGHKSETSQPKKKLHLSYIFLHLSANFWLKIQNTHCYRNLGTFLTSGQLALNGPAVIYSKIQNMFRRAP